MRDAEEKSKKAKKCLFSGTNIRVPSYNDISGGKNKKIDSTKAKTLFNFLKD